MHAGDQVKLVMPGGGGYGPVAERDVTLVERDIENGFISTERARIDYGYEPLDGEGLHG
ncbi:hypothetical protein BH23CHL5_BH23CHL5_04100 [soil metagenome]